MADRVYAAIDLKSFYASVECVERGLDPLNTNLVVADTSRTEKTICLAVSPSLKAYGIPGRARLFEVNERVRDINTKRKNAAPNRTLQGESFYDSELCDNPSLALTYIAAVPRMSFYMEYSTRIYEIYLRYVAPEDIHVYSIDEVFLDLTPYVELYKTNARELTMRLVREVLRETGITATAGIGTNLYLAKIAMDIEAKHTMPDENGVRIAELDEMQYRRSLWSHRPLTDFWRVGSGYAEKLAANGIFTMGDIARCSIGGDEDYQNEELLYRLFGVNAELLIDHAWGYEPCTIAQIKAYRPESNSICSGQVLQTAYTAEKARIVAYEMADALSLDLLEKRCVTDQLILMIGYDIDSLNDPTVRRAYKGEIHRDRYGRLVPKHTNGTENLGGHTSSSKRIIAAILKLYDEIVNPLLLIRRITITANHVLSETAVHETSDAEQLNLFTDFDAKEREYASSGQSAERERKTQEAVLSIKQRFGRNAILKGMNLLDGATAAMRNGQIGGHKA